MLPPVGWLPQQICVAFDGSIWAVDNQGSLYQYTSEQWQLVTSSPSVYMIAAVSDHSIWGICLGAKDSISQFDGHSWQAVTQAPALGTFQVGISVLPQISVDLDGTVWCLDLNGVPWKCVTRRGSEWQRQMMPTGMSGITASSNVTAFAVNNDSSGPQAFYSDEKSTSWLTSNDEGTWQVASASNYRCTYLGTAHQQDTGELFFYGVTTDGNLILGYQHLSYSMTPVNANKSLTGATVQISALNTNSWFITSVMDGELYVQWGNSTNPLNFGPLPGQMICVTGTPDGSSAPTNLKQLVAMPWLQTSIGFYCAVLDNSGNISVVFNLSAVSENSFDTIGIGSFVPLTGNQAQTISPLTAVSSVSSLIDDTGMIRIYATDSNAQLWLIRQTGLSGDPTNNNPWTWTYWHPLGNDCQFMANGPDTHQTRELFSIDADSFLNFLSQDSVTSNWSSLQIRKPNGTLDDPYYVSQYVTEVTVYNQSENPEPNVKLTVSVAEPVSVWVSGIQYNLDSATPATFTTNVMGKVTLSTLALGLHTAQLTFEADGFAAPYAAYPPQNIQSRLQAVDEGTLQGAQSRIQSVPTEKNAPLVAKGQQGNCGTAATVVQNVFQIKKNANIQPGTPTGAASSSGQPNDKTLRELWSSKVISIRPILSATETLSQEPGSWDSFWDDLKHFGEDIWHGIRNGIIVVETIAAHVKAETLDLTLSIENVGKALVSFAVKTIDDVVHAVTSAFRWLGAKVEQAIDWLKEFFSWSDILHTKQVMEYYVNQVISNVTNNLNSTSPNYIKPFVKTQFESLINLIQGTSKQPSVFDQAKTVLGNTSFNDSVSNATVDPKVGSKGLNPKGAHDTYKAHQVKSNYARTKSETYIHRGGKVTPSAGGATMALDAGALDSFFSLVQAELGLNDDNSPFRVAQKSFQNSMQQMKHPQGLFDTAINDFLSIVKELVLVVVDLLEDVVLALLDLAGEGIAAFQDMLNFPLRIPVISWLYEKISGHPLTLLDLFCLIMSIPATLIYKVIWGGADATPPFTQAQAQAITSRAIAWPQIQGTELGVSPIPLAAPSELDATALSEILGILSLINGLAYGFIDFATDIDSLGGGEVDISTFLSGTTLVLSLTGFGLSVPYAVLEKSPNDRTAADVMYATVWGLSVPSILLNLASFLSTKYQQRLAKYLDFGPETVAALGTVQIGIGVAAAIQYGQQGSGYNGFYSAAGIISPIPSVVKLLLIPKSTELLLIVGPVDLICDFGNALCSVVEDV